MNLGASTSKLGRDFAMSKPDPEGVFSRLIFVQILRVSIFSSDTMSSRRRFHRVIKKLRPSRWPCTPLPSCTITHPWGYLKPSICFSLVFSTKPAICGAAAFLAHPIKTVSITHARSILLFIESPFP
jgi:hypothetical protein